MNDDGYYWTVELEEYEQWLADEQAQKEYQEWLIEKENKNDTRRIIRSTETPF